jgi:hypothetical protein
MKIRDRWIGTENTILKDLQRNNSPFGIIAGLADFGGITFPRGFKLVNEKFGNLDLSNVTFMGMWIEKCSFSNLISAMIQLDY